MQGPEAVAAALADRLGARLPDQLATMRATRGISTRDLPDPATVEPHDRLRLAAEEYPGVLVVVGSLTRLIPAGRNDDTGQDLIGRYPFRAYLWVRGDDERTTDLARKRYALATREILLGRITLTDADLETTGAATPYEAPGPVVDPLTVTEDYAPIAVDDAGATIAAAYVAADT